MTLSTSGPKWTFGAISLVLCGFVVALASFGLLAPATPIAGVGTVITLLLSSGMIAAAYVVAGCGIGRLVSHACRRAAGIQFPLFLQGLLGLGVLLWLSHVLGVCGLLSGARGAWIAWIVVALGLAVMAAEVAGAFGGQLKPERWSVPSVWWLTAAPPIALLVVAASNPPGGLWTGSDSEAGAYDVQSYHLQLPKEWAVSRADAGPGRLWPLEHNVYSFLPSYMEGAYLHLAAMTSAGTPSGGNFVAGRGTGVIAAQYLHAAFGFAAMLAIAGTLSGLGGTGRPGASRGGGSSCRAAAIIAGAAMIAVPWVTVVGSLAYNELAVVAMTIGGIAMALVPTFGPPAPAEHAPRGKGGPITHASRQAAEGGRAGGGALEGSEARRSVALRGLLAGFLLGIACSAKPTALFLCAPLAGIVLIFARPFRVRTALTLAAWSSLGGLIALAPWLVRNYLACGNPVFPFLHRIFGDSHWSAEQFARYAHAHAFDGGLADRLTLLLSTSRGVFHAQWSVLFPLGLLSLVGAAARRDTRRLALVLLVGLVVQLAAWMLFTHLQSRFLLPSVVPLCLGIGLGTIALTRWIESRAVRGSAAVSDVMHAGGLLVAALVPVSLTGWSILNFAAQRDGSPNLLLVPGVETITGRTYAAELAQLDDAAREQTLRENAGTIIACNYRLGPEDALYLVGDAAPLYYAPMRTNGVTGVWYNTTWDSSPLGLAVRQAPDDPAAWTGAVRDAMRRRLEAAGRRLRDVYVLVDFAEIARLYPSDPAAPVWFDPALSAAVASRWLNQEAEVVQAWPDEKVHGVYLYRLKGSQP